MHESMAKIEATNKKSGRVLARSVHLTIAMSRSHQATTRQRWLLPLEATPAQDDADQQDLATTAGLGPSRAPSKHALWSSTACWWRCLVHRPSPEGQSPSSGTVMLVRACPATYQHGGITTPMVPAP